jgi:hypothetical protein
MRDMHKCDWSMKIITVLVILLVVLASYSILECPHETVPSYSNVGYSGETSIGHSITFFSYWKSSINYAWFSWNATQNWVNDTFTNFVSPEAWLNVTKELPLLNCTSFQTVSWRFFANDTNGVCVGTDIYNITLAYYETRTLTIESCTIGDWSATGTTPYLNAVDYPTNYINTSSTNKNTGPFVLSNISETNYLLATAIVNLSYNTNGGIGQIELNDSVVGEAISIPNSGGTWNSSLLTTLVLSGNANDLYVKFHSGNCTQIIIDYVTVTVQYYTLINRLRYYLDSPNLNWTAEGSNYFGMLFNKQTISDMENYVDTMASQQKWIEVLQWSAYLQKLGIERETSIKYALGNLTQCDKLPNTTYPTSFLIYFRDVLYSCFYFSNKYNYLTDKWNVTAAYEFFTDSLANSNAKSGFYWYPTGHVTNVYNRFYDENAQTIQAYLTFYDLGIAEALTKAEEVWDYINVLHWKETEEYFMYRPDQPYYECEASFFLKIIALLRYADFNIGNSSRLFLDTYNRFLAHEWLSHQWIEDDTRQTSTYAVIHANPTNYQRRLQNSLGAWTTLLGVYQLLNSTAQANLKDMCDTVWYRLYDSKSLLYNSTTDMFKWYGSAYEPENSLSSSSATIGAMVLHLLSGISPYNTTTPFPLEEYHYEYIYDTNPNLLRIDATNNMLNVSVQSAGALKFTFGGSEVLYNFPSSGVYNITWNVAWTQILSADKLSELPSGLKYLTSVSNVGVDGTLMAGQSVTFRANW